MAQRRGRVTTGPCEAFTNRNRGDVPADEGLKQDDVTDRDVRMRYEHMEAPQRRDADELFRGHVTYGRLPRLQPKSVRLYVSSTYTDMVHEKDALVKQTYPDLRAYCKEAYGIEFQAVDPRWGVADETYPDHSTSDLCLEEIRRCKEEALGPHVLLLLGDKLGVAELPRYISSHVFAAVQQALSDACDDAGFLVTWYKEDTNGREEGFYVLQPTSTILGANWEERPWQQCRQQLVEQLQKGISLCLEHKTLDEAQVADVRCLPGIRQETGYVLDDSPKDDIITVQRSIKDLKSHLVHKVAPQFADMRADSNDLDQESFRALRALKEESRKMAGKVNTFSNHVLWADPTGMNLARHTEHINSLCTFVYQRTRALIDKHMEEYTAVVRDELYEEVLKHWTKGEELTQLFLGRQEALCDIREYLLRMSDQPFIIDGETGIGKTSVISSAAHETLSWLRDEGHHINTAIVLRLCGATPASSDLRQLVHSLCCQIAYAVDGSYKSVPTDFREQVTYFQNILTSGCFRGVLVIYIDGLNGLSGRDGAHLLDWMPRQIANNIKLVISASTAHNSHVLSTLLAKYPDAENRLTLGYLDPYECLDIVVKVMLYSDRRLDERQSKVLERAISQCPSPLFAQVAYEEVVNWRSYEEDRCICLSVERCFLMILEHLEEKHGQLLLRHCLGYITSSTYGVSEAELMDLLSMDDIVMANLTDTRTRPDMARCPDIIWLRLYHDIKGFLTTRDVDNTTVLFWNHDAFADVVSKRYLTDRLHRTYLHSVMADFYLGCGSCVARPYTPLVTSALDVSAPLRHVLSQPLTYGQSHHSCPGTRPQGSAAKDYNLRKLRELPHHLKGSKRHEELYELVLFNYEWLLIKMKVCPLSEVLMDYEGMSGRPKEADVVVETLLMSHSALRVDGNALCTELLGRLLPYRNKCASIRTMLDQCDSAGHKLVPFSPHWQMYLTPGAPLKYIHNIILSGYSALGKEKRAKVHFAVLNNDECFSLLCKHPKSKTLHVWDILGEYVASPLQLPEPCDILPTPDGQSLICFCVEKGAVRIVDFKNGRQIHEINYGKSKSPITEVTVTNKYIAFTLGPQIPGPCVIDICAGAEMRRLNYQSAAVALSPSERYLACSHGTDLVLLQLPLLEKKCTVGMRVPIEKIVFPKDDTRMYVKTQGNLVQAVSVDLKMKRSQVKQLFAGNVDVEDILLSHDSSMLLVRALYSLTVIDLENFTKTLVKDMPYEDFVEDASPFLDAGFSHDDKLVLGARHRHLAVWDAKSGCPVALLNFAPSPIDKLCICKHRNLAFTVHEDRSMQLWDLSSVGQNIQHSKIVTHSPVDLLAGAQKGDRLLCCSLSSNGAAVYSLKSNSVERHVIHPSIAGDSVSSLLISPSGRYGITRIQNTDHPEYAEEEWGILYEDILWDLDSGRPVQMVTNSRYAFFSSDASRVVFVPCVEYDLTAPTRRVYNLVIIELGHSLPERHIVELPAGDLFCEPVSLCEGTYLVFPHCDESLDTRLCVYNTDANMDAVGFVHEADFTNGEFKGNLTRIVDVRPVDEGRVAVILGKDLPQLWYKEDGTLDRSKTVDKCAILYTPSTGVKIHISKYLEPDTDLGCLLGSATNSLLVCGCTLYNSTSGQMIRHMSGLQKATNTRQGQRVFLVNGRYIAVVAPSTLAVWIVRTSDGELNNTILTHGVVRYISKVKDDRTLAIGCGDGRVLVVTLLLGEPDPVTQIIRKLPSRSPDKQDTPRESQLEAKENDSSRDVMFELSPLTWRELMLAPKANGFGPMAV